MRASSEVSTSGLYVYAFDPALLICTRIKISGERPDFFRVSSLAYPNLLGKKGYVVVVVVVVVKTRFLLTFRSNPN